MEETGNPTPALAEAVQAVAVAVEVEASELAEARVEAAEAVAEAALDHAEAVEISAVEAIEESREEIALERDALKWQAMTQELALIRSTQVSLQTLVETQTSLIQAMAGPFLKLLEQAQEPDPHPHSLKSTPAQSAEPTDPSELSQSSGADEKPEPKTKHRKSRLI